MPTNDENDPAADVSAGPQQVAPPRRRHLLRLLTGLTAGVLLVDQLTKVWAVAALEEGERIPLLGDLFGLQLIRNPGAALGIATGMTWVLTVVAVVVVVVVARASRRIGSTGWAVALGLLLGGALGNLVDRLVREPGVGSGHVIDFLAYWRLFIGNVADIAIVAAAVLVVLLTARGIHLDGTRDSDADAGPAPDGSDPDGTDPDGTDLHGTAPDASRDAVDRADVPHAEGAREDRP